MDDARLFLCARCQRQVLICSRCDRGPAVLRCALQRPRPRSITARSGTPVSAIATWPTLPCRTSTALPAPVPRRGLPRESDASRFRIAPMRCCTRSPSSCDARGESVHVPQAGHHDALPLLCTCGQRVRPPSLAASTGAPAPAHPHMALSDEHDGDRRRTQGADPALPLRRALARGHHRLPARRPSLHRRAGGVAPFQWTVKDLGFMQRPDSSSRRPSGIADRGPGDDDGGYTIPR